MSESFPLTPDQQEITKQRIIHDASLLIGGAAIDAAGALSLTSEQIDALRQEAPSSSDNLSADSREIIFDPETSGMSPERLKEIIGNSIYGITFRRLHQDYGEQTLTFAGRGQFPADYGSRNLVLGGNVKEHRVNDYTVQNLPEYVAQGAAELVTYNRNVSPSGELMGVAEPLSLINYTTIRDSAGGNKYPYPEIPGKERSRDVTLSYGILLPDSEAKEVFEAMRANPELTRMTADEMIVNPVADHSQLTGDMSDWPIYRPPYEQWHNINEAAGRPDRMVFNTVVHNRQIAESQTVEF